MNPVTVSQHGRIAVITCDWPPVNALSHAVRQGLTSAIEAADGDQAVSAIIIRCAGRTFFAGADIAEFGKPPREPLLGEVIDRIERSAKPIVAGLHGTALGGGLELALGCHYRVALPGTRLGLPEVKLGLIPGAGGTQRLPRLMGVLPALDAMVGGAPFDAARALETGVIDAIVQDLDAALIGFAESVASRRPLPVIGEGDGKLIEAQTDPDLFDRFAAGIARKTRSQQAPLKIVEAVRSSLSLTFREGLERERELFLGLLASPESAALRHVFFAEREAAKVPRISADTRRLPVGAAAVIGAGTMGGGIAMNFANAGIPVTLIETNQEALDRGLGIIAGNYRATAKRGGLSADEAEARLARITGSIRLDDAASADIVTEAVFEEMGLKKELFRALDRIMGPEAILASNTSTLDLDEIAGATTRPERVIGMHYFSPANVMKLLELVRGKATAPEVIATALALAPKLGKIPALVGVCYGFVGNRMLHQRAAELEWVLIEGASPEDADRALTAFGFPMGHCAMSDLAGLDVGYRIRRGLGIRQEIPDRLVEAGRLGQKSKAGYFRYVDGDRTPRPDPVVDAVIEDVAASFGIQRRAIPPAEIVDRLLFPMINEAARILEEGIALRASDIDVIWVHGYGFPAYRGGPMYWADRLGLPRIRDTLQTLHERTGRARLKPAPLLAELAAAGRGFSDWRRS